MRNFKSLHDIQKENNAISKTVSSAFEFVRIGEIDTIKESFQAEVIIESKWLSTDDIEIYEPKKHWNPKLFVENAIVVKEAISYDVIKEQSQTYIQETRIVSGTFWISLDLHYVMSKFSSTSFNIRMKYHCFFSIISFHLIFKS
jgi:hypothetical protein